MSRRRIEEQKRLRKEHTGEETRVRVDKPNNYDENRRAKEAKKEQANQENKRRVDELSG